MPSGTKTRSKTKAAPTPVVEVEEEDLEEVEETDEASDTAPTKSSNKQPEVTFGASDLAKHLSTAQKPVSARDIRILIRKMARDGSGRVHREIVPGNRTRYNWSGVDDPEVQSIIAAFNAGELEADKKAKLDALKQSKAAQRAAKAEEVEETEETEEAPAPTPKAKTKRAAKKVAPEPVVEVDEDDEDLDLDEE